MAVGIYVDQAAPCGGYGPPVLTTYAIDYKGNITDNQALIYPSVTLSSMQINPQGNLLAVGGNIGDPTYTNALTGLEVFHFNGANPITRYSSVLTSAAIDTVSWDKNNHLYALSKSTNKLYVYTITPTNITPVSGSSYTIASPSQLVVVPK